MTDTTAPPLTPIDTGEVCEPHIWNTTNPDHIGKVDFDDDSGMTVATVQLVKNAAGGYTAIVTQLGFEAVSVDLQEER